MEESNKCPKCEGEMEEGLVPDFYNPGGFSKHLWGKENPGSFNRNPQDNREVITYRCKNCGYLESYAK